MAEVEISWSTFYINIAI